MRIAFVSIPFYAIHVFQVGFRHHKDYVAYTWAKQEESDYLRQEHHVRHETINTINTHTNMTCVSAEVKDTAVTDQLFYIPTCAGYLRRGRVTKGGW